jgi:hypothetical protein
MPFTFICNVVALVLAILAALLPPRILSERVSLGWLSLAFFFLGLVLGGRIH